MAISNTTLTTASQDIFVCPASQEHAVTCVIFCNTSGSDITINVNAVPSGGTVGTGNQIIKDLLVPSSETFSFDTEKLVLSAGDKISATASANSSVTATVSSMRVS